MILGFTGTRHSPTTPQRLWLITQFDDDVCGFHHGACVGADEMAHDIAACTDIPITVHPPVDQRLMMPAFKWSERDCIYVMPAKAYHERNRDIVAACDRLIALPDGPRRPHSGTWYTIDYATGANQILTANRRVVPVTVCYPDGTLDQPEAAQ